ASSATIAARSYDPFSGLYGRSTKYQPSTSPSSRVRRKPVYLSYSRVWSVIADSQLRAKRRAPLNDIGGKHAVNACDGTLDDVVDAGEFGFGLFVGHS